MRNHKDYLPEPAPTRWYVVASREAALIYGEKKGSLSLLNRFFNARGALKERDLDSDRAGSRSAGSNSTHHTLDRHNHQLEQVARDLAKRVCRYLSSELAARSFDELFLVAEPGYLGVLRNALPAELRKRVCRVIPKEFTADSTQRLEQRFKESRILPQNASKTADLRGE